MKQSLLFTKTKKERPQNEISESASLLIRAGYISKHMAGVYTLLPLGHLVIQNICSIVRSEMEVLGAIELTMNTIQRKDIWEQTNRWDDQVVDVWFKTRLKNKTEVGLGFTQEETLVDILKEHIFSYKDLPQYIYQIQTKFRNELRAKSGILRGREFLMKDLYSFNKSPKEQDIFYQQVTAAYLKIFKQCEIDKETYLTIASGGTFSKFSHEFQTISNAGEDTIYIHPSKKIAINKEVYSPGVVKELGYKKE